MERWSQCTYRCVVLPDGIIGILPTSSFSCFNAPTGAWCSLTSRIRVLSLGLGSQCTYRCVVLPDKRLVITIKDDRSQCTYRCVVLPDVQGCGAGRSYILVSMHLQVRGAP